MKTRVFGTIAFVLLTSASIVRAQSFTFVTKASPPAMRVGGTTATGQPYGATATSSTRETMMAGKKKTGTQNCITMTQSPNNKVFDSHAMCLVTEADGTYNSVLGCSSVGQGTTACWGRMTGQTGVYANRTGVVSSTGMDGVRTGSGQWDQ